MAQEMKLEPPPGYTFVRGHYRGGKSRDTFYRSRSALLTLQGTDSNIPDPDQVTDLSLDQDWFRFEEEVAQLLQRLGFKVMNRAPRGGGGVDVYAQRGQGENVEDWLVECKCWSPQNLVGVSVVRS